MKKYILLAGTVAVVLVISGCTNNKQSNETMNGKLLVNKLEEYETDGKVIKDTVYDTYTDKNKFIEGTPRYLPKMAKTSSGNAIRYALLESKHTPDNMGATVISFDRNSIKN